MKELCFLFIVCVLTGSVWAMEVLVPASVSCRTDLPQPDTNRSDSSKLSIRSDASSAKSWIKFDLNAVDANDIRGAILRLTLHEDEGDHFFDVSAVNDDCLDNINWAERDITWNNAPANDTADFVNPDFTKATLMGTVDMTGNFLAGSQHFLDVTSAVQTDTDGIVQFVLHNSTSLLNCATHDHPQGADYHPTLILTLPPAGSDYPNPAIDQVVPTNLSSLSWINADPNDSSNAITCDVYLGTDLDKMSMDKVTLSAGDTSVAINMDNFPSFGDLANDTMYYWYVDCHDPSRVPELIDGELWAFYVGQSPSVNAGLNQTGWLPDTNGLTVSLDATTSDDGVYTVVWTQVSNGAPAVTIDPANVDNTSVNITARGDYEFRLTADDGVLQTEDTVRIVVGDDVCDASHIETGDAFNVADQNEDCIVNLTDLVALIINDWLKCTDDLTNCNGL